MSDPPLPAPAAQHNAAASAAAAAAPTFTAEYDMLRHAGVMGTPLRGGPNPAQYSPDTAAANTPETNNTNTNSLPSPASPRIDVPAPAAPANNVVQMPLLQPTAAYDMYKLTTEWQMPRNPKHKGSLYRHSGDVDERDADFGTHSMRKMPTTYSVHLGCSRDRVEIQGRWKGRRGSNIVDRYLK